MKKDLKEFSTTQLLEEIEKEKNDDDFCKILSEIYERTPFETIQEKFNELEEQIEKLEEENGKLRNQMRLHAHIDGKTVVEI